MQCVTSLILKKRSGILSRKECTLLLLFFQKILFAFSIFTQNALTTLKEIICHESIAQITLKLPLLLRKRKEKKELKKRNVRKKISEKKRGKRGLLLFSLSSKRSGTPPLLSLLGAALKRVPLFNTLNLCYYQKGFLVKLQQGTNFEEV